MVVMVQNLHFEEGNLRTDANQPCLYFSLSLEVMIRFDSWRNLLK